MMRMPNDVSIAGQARIGGKRPALARSFSRLGLLPALHSVRRLLRGDLRILTYHRVLDIDPAKFDFDRALVSASAEQFREQMAYVKKCFQPMRFRDVLEHLDEGRPLPRDALIITFDDGYDDNYRVAFSILRELGLPATFFVSTGHIDTGQPYAYDWLVYMLMRTPATHVELPEIDLTLSLPPSREGREAVGADLLDRLKLLDDDRQSSLIGRLEQIWSMPRRPHPDCRPMTWDQLREMHASGMEIGSHGVDHRMLAQLPVAAMRAEVSESRATLERELGVAPEVLSYPVGGSNAFSADVIEALKAEKFRIGCSYISGSNRLPLGDLYALQRLPVEQYIDQDWFCGMLVSPELFSHRKRQRSG